MLLAEDARQHRGLGVGSGRCNDDEQVSGEHGIQVIKPEIPGQGDEKEQGSVNFSENPKPETRNPNQGDEEEEGNVNV